MKRLKRCVKMDKTSKNGPKHSKRHKFVQKKPKSSKNLKILMPVISILQILWAVFMKCCVQS